MSDSRQCYARLDLKQRVRVGCLRNNKPEVDLKFPDERLLNLFTPVVGTIQLQPTSIWILVQLIVYLLSCLLIYPRLEKVTFRSVHIHLSYTLQTVKVLEESVYKAVYQSTQLPKRLTSRLVYTYLSHVLYLLCHLRQSM